VLQATKLIDTYWQ